jgi:prephenate dehydrogenase
VATALPRAVQAEARPRAVDATVRPRAIDGEPLRKLAVIGLGLLGGSVALAARERGLAAEIAAVDPALTQDQAGGFPLVCLEEAVREADLVVLAVPPAAADGVLAALVPFLNERTLLTDTASVKQPIAQAARARLRWPQHCIGAHPMTGGDRQGFAHARANLFEGAACLIAVTGAEPETATTAVEGFWQGLGARTVRTSPQAHDETVALLSHVPHLIAYAFACAFARELESGGMGQLAGPGLRDFTRIARSSPELWQEILLMNRGPVAQRAREFAKALDEATVALEQGDPGALAPILRAGRDALESLQR